jgi:hypothetical protein
MIILTIMEAIPQLTESLARRARSQQVNWPELAAISPYLFTSHLM